MMCLDIIYCSWIKQQSLFLYAVEEAGKPDGKDKEVVGGETKTEGASEGKAEATSST